MSTHFEPKNHVAHCPLGKRVIRKLSQRCSFWQLRAAKAIFSRRYCYSHCVLSERTHAMCCFRFKECTQSLFYSILTMIITLHACKQKVSLSF